MDKQKFGAFIAEKRRDGGMTQAQLAAKIHVTDKAVSKWERGECYPDITLFEPLSAALDSSMSELISSETQGKPLSGDEQAVVQEVLALGIRQKREVLGTTARGLLVLAAIWLLGALSSLSDILFSQPFLGNLFVESPVLSFVVMGLLSVFFVFCAIYIQKVKNRK